MPEVNYNQSITENYRSLLERHRKISLAERDGTATCLHCNRLKSSHLSDNRCSTNAMSMLFTNIQREKKIAIERALELIEELQTL